MACTSGDGRISDDNPTLLLLVSLDGIAVAVMVTTIRSCCGSTIVSFPPLFIVPYPDQVDKEETERFKIPENPFHDDDDARNRSTEGYAAGTAELRQLT